MSARGPSQLVAIAALTTTTTIWGAMIPLTHVLVSFHDPVFVAFFRYLIGLLPLLAYLAWREGRRLLPPRLAPGKVFALGSGMAGFAALYGIGIQFAGPVSSAIVLACGPLIAAIMARLLLKAPWERGLPLSLALVIVGSLLVSFGRPDGGGGSLASHGGEALLIVAMICWNWYSIRAPQWLLPLGFTQGAMSGATILSGTALLLLVYVVLLPLGLTRPLDRFPDLTEWGYYALCGFGGVGVAIPFWNFAVSRLTLPVAALYLNLAAPVAVIVAALAFGAPVAWLQLLGGVIVLSGVLQLQVRRLKAARAAAAG